MLHFIVAVPYVGLVVILTNGDRRYRPDRLFVVSSIAVSSVGASVVSSVGAVLSVESSGCGSKGSVTALTVSLNDIPGSRYILLYESDRS